MAKPKIKGKERQQQGNIIASPVATHHSSEHEPPMFSMRYLHKDYGIEKCEKDDQAAFAKRLCKLSEMTWAKIKTCDRHGLGHEKIAQNSIRPSLPSHITPEVDILSFRFNGMKPMLGYRNQAVFYVIIIDPKMDAYKH